MLLLNTGCEKQIEELIEAVVLPMREADRFKKIGISPPKGVLLWGPPGTGKTLLARACAKHTDAGTLSNQYFSIFSKKLDKQY